MRWRSCLTSAWKECVFFSICIFESTEHEPMSLAPSQRSAGAVSVARRKFGADGCDSSTPGDQGTVKAARATEVPGGHEPCIVMQLVPAAGAGVRRD